MLENEVLEVNNFFKSKKGRRNLERKPYFCLTYSLLYCTSVKLYIRHFLIYLYFVKGDLKECPLVKFSISQLMVISASKKESTDNNIILVIRILKI